MSISSNVSSISGPQPFQRSRLPYLKAGWLPIPLQPKDKRPASDGYTGKKNKYPSTNSAKVAFVKGFKDDPKVEESANVGVWLSDEVIGIDVDDYSTSGGRSKKGYDELAELIEELGDLPPTWVSTARSDGKSGIRFFRIPMGLSWSGKASSNIDVIQRGHRYAVVAPSIHPDIDAQYCWYTAEEWSLAEERGDCNGLGSITPAVVNGKPVGIPVVADLPFLPDKWVDYLTRGRMASTEKSIDMDSTYDEVKDWYSEHTRQGEMCRSMKKRLKTAIDRVENESAAHDPLVAGHFSIIMAGVEGHSGSTKAVNAMNKAWHDRLEAEEGKRGSEWKNELFRSRSGAMRMAKARVDEMIAAGADPLRSRCTCVDLSEALGGDSPKVPSSLALVPQGAGEDDSDDENEPKSPGDFRMNDDGNAEFMHYLYGENLRWVHDHRRFIHWNGKRWEVDTERHIRTRRGFQLVRDQQEKYAQALHTVAEGFAEDLEKVRETRTNDGSIGAADAEYKDAKKLANSWTEWAKRSGNVQPVLSSLDAFSTAAEDTSMDLSQLDRSPRLMGVANGTLVLGDSTVELRPTDRDDYITLNTEMEYVEGGMAELKKRGGDSFLGVKLWEKYLNTFIPDMELRNFIQKVAGYSLWGGNPERLMVFLYGTTSTGKSVFLSAIQKALGEYSDTFPLSVFKSNDEKNPILIGLKDKRVLTASEVGVAEGLDESIVKRLVGDDPTTARMLNSNDRHTFTIKGLPIIATNTPPNIPHSDAGLAKRLLVIPFDHQAAEEDSGAKDRMLAVAGPAILSWMVDGWLMYKKEGLSREDWPEAITGSTSGFTEDLSEFGVFVRDCLLTVDYDPTDEDTRRDTSMSLDQIHKLYSKWAERNNEEPIGQRMLSRKLASNSMKLVQGKYFDGQNSKRYRGITRFVMGEADVVNFKGGGPAS